MKSSTEDGVPPFGPSWTPAEIRVAVWKEELTVEEAYMIGTIESLTKIDKTGQVIPCWASNAYLGKCQGVKEDRAKQIISSLKRKGWIKQVGFDGRHRLLLASYDKRIEEYQTRRVGKNSQAAREKIPTNGLPTVNLKSNNTVSLRSTERKMFFKTEEEPKAIPFDERMAIQLYKELATKRKVSKASSTKKWALEFAKLRKHFTKKEIKATLNWYCERIGEQYIHEAFSAKSFRDKFPKIQTAMNRKSPAVEKELPISSDTKRALELLANLNWAGDLSSQLPQAVEHSIVNFKATGQKVLAKLKAYDGKQRDPFVRLLTAMSHLWLDLRKADFANYHFQRVHQSIGNWKDFRGKLTSYAWSHDENTPGGKLVWRSYRQFIKDYTLPEKVEPFFQQLKEFLTNEG